MLIIFGNKDFLLHRGRVRERFTCPHCKHDLNFILNTRASWFTLFWIPVFPFRFERRVECPLCGSLVKASGQEYDEMLRNRYKDRIRRL